MSITLKSGLAIESPRHLILAFVEHWHHMYDGIDVLQDNLLRVSDIAVSTMLNSRISGNTGAQIYSARRPVEEALVQIPNDIDLLDSATDDEVPAARHISAAITAMCRVPRAKLSVATKILHKKRPGLIPIFDSWVELQYKPQCPTVRGRSWGDYGVALTRCMRRDMKAQESLLRDLESELAVAGKPMTSSRILNAMIWCVKSDHEQWLMNNYPLRS